MILSLVAIIAFGHQGEPQAPKPLTAGQLISSALKKYYDAKSASGTIRFTQEARGVSLTFETDFALDRPSKFLIRQRRLGKEPRQWLSVSDGKYFSFDMPQQALGRERTRELVMQNGRAQTFDTMYPVAAQSLGERSPILDIVFARRADLMELRSHWGSPKLVGKTRIGDVEANLIEGDYLEVPNAPATGAYQFAITDAGDILRYQEKHRIGVPNQPNEIVEVLSTWESKIKLDTPNPDSVYAVKG